MKRNSNTTNELQCKCTAVLLVMVNNTIIFDELIRIVYEQQFFSISDHLNQTIFAPSLDKY